MAYRIRYALTQEPMIQRMAGTVEIDETYVGGKRRVGPHAIKPGVRPKDRVNAVDNKTAVVSIVQRGRLVRSHHVQHVTAANLRPLIEASVASDAQIMTDSGTVLAGALMGRNHYQVNPSADEYIRWER